MATRTGQTGFPVSPARTQSRQQPGVGYLSGLLAALTDSLEQPISLGARRLLLTSLSGRVRPETLSEATDIVTHHQGVMWLLAAGCASQCIGRWDLGETAHTHPQRFSHLSEWQRSGDDSGDFPPKVGEEFWTPYSQNSAHWGQPKSHSIDDLGLKRSARTPRKWAPPYPCCRMCHRRPCASSHRSSRGTSLDTCLRSHSWPHSWCSGPSTQIWTQTWPSLSPPGPASPRSSSGSGCSPRSPAGPRHHLRTTEGTGLRRRRLCSSRLDPWWQARRPQGAAGTLAFELALLNRKARSFSPFGHHV